jgi:hypothetical protein
MKDGLIPTALGTVVTASAIALRTMDLGKKGIKQKDIIPMVETAVIGFGLAHIVLGTIDLVQNKR